jgi:transcriptional regulator with XRE-family HTH domain
MTIAPTALRTALFLSGLKQIEIAKRAAIHETRLSKISRGHVEATADEMKRLAKVLRKPVDEIFPGQALA